MSLALHFYKFVEGYTVLLAWIVIPLSYYSIFLWVKNNSMHIEMPDLELGDSEGATSESESQGESAQEAPVVEASENPQGENNKEAA